MPKKCRVIYMDDNSVRVIHPAPKSRRPGESEEEWYQRVFETTIAKNPELQGKEHHDMLKAELPERATRAGWKRPAAGKGIDIDHDEVAAWHRAKQEAIEIQEELKAMAKERIEAKRGNT